MLRVAPYLLLVLILYLLFSYLENFQPQIADDILTEIDVFGLSKTANSEHERLSKIKNLTIPYEEKQVLINRTVFMGCSPDMMVMALGQPSKPPIKKLWPQQHTMLTYYVYFLPHDKRPTVLVFKEDKLIWAYKDSALVWN